LTHQIVLGLPLFNFGLYTEPIPLLLSPAACAGLVPGEARSSGLG